MLMVDDDIQMQLDVILDRFAQSGKQEKFKIFAQNFLKWPNQPEIAKKWPKTTDKLYRRSIQRKNAEVHQKSN